MKIFDRMKKIILIETSTALCSVALCEDGKILAYRESNALKAHASLTAVFVQEVLAESGCTIADCDAICVSMGPGSYTGLRVGVSTAKGLCFGAKKPMLAVGTLDTLVAQALDIMPDCSGQPWKHIVPMIDARRMEVYSAVFSPVTDSTPDTASYESSAPSPQNATGSDSTPAKGTVQALGWMQTTETEPKIIDGDSFAELLKDGPVLFIGDGAGKCEGTITSPNARFMQCCPKASSMAALAAAELTLGHTRDVAYFEPFYLKEFQVTTSKKKLF